MSTDGHVQCDGEEAHAELKWAPSEITVGVSFTLIKGGYGEGSASKGKQF
jgi:hypothetical protein